MNLRTPFAITIAASALALGASAASAEPSHDDDRLGIGLTAGAGVTGFTDDQANDVAKAGGMWEVRGVFGVNSPLAVEAAYIGSAQTIDLPLIDDVSLIGNGLEGALRYNLGTYAVQPYVVGGAGWTHYDVRIDDMDVDVPTDDDVLTIPAGAGVSFYAGPALIDLRASYRFAFDDELIQDEGEFEKRESLDTWSATARAGVTF